MTPAVRERAIGKVDELWLCVLALASVRSPAAFYALHDEAAALVKEIEEDASRAPRSVAETARKS